MDTEASEIYRRNIDRVYRICYLRLQNRAEAEDAAQNVFLRYLRSPKPFRDAEHEKAYFIVCARNESCSAAKSYWRTHRVPLEEAADYADEDQPADGAEMILALPPKYRDVLYLYYCEEYSTKEIARILHRTESTVRSQLARGRARLKVDLEGNYEQHP